MDLVVFEYDQNYVLECFRSGEFDFANGVSEAGETEFFRYIGAKKILGKLAETYLSPRGKEEVPLWMYVASNLSMRLHGVHSFHAYPYVIRCGGMLNAFGPEVARDGGDAHYQQRHEYPESARSTQADADENAQEGLHQIAALECRRGVGHGLGNARQRSLRGIELFFIKVSS